MIFFPNPSWLPLASVMLHRGTLTASLPVKIGQVPNGKDRLPTSNHHFSGAMLNFGGVFLVSFLLTDIKDSFPIFNCLCFV